MRFNSCLLLTEGAHGMISQVEGLAKALGINFKHCNVNLKSFWKKIPINFVPVRRGVVSDDLPNLTEPTLLISCGKNSIISSLILKKENPNHFNIHIQNP
ncbi:MAG: ELM1/GtrOC1 family putative glycosyltransferase, partial [Candidatus Fonsibacter sp.]